MTASWIQLDPPQAISPWRIGMPWFYETAGITARVTAIDRENGRLRIEVEPEQSRHVGQCPSQRRS